MRDSLLGWCWCAVVWSGVLAASGSRAWSQESGREAVRSELTIIGIDGQSRQVVHEAPRRMEAPNWSPDGSYLMYNAGGRLWTLPVKGGTPRAINVEPISWVDVNRGLAPDGRRLAISAGPIFVLPPAGGAGKPVTAQQAWFHGWSPDGRTLAFSADRGQGLDVYTVPAAGGAERRLTANAGSDDAPSFSPDGRWVYFNSNRAGSQDIWRVPADGPGDAKAERITSDGLNDWFPHPSPDGKWLVFLSYPGDLPGHRTDEDVVIRRMPLPGEKPGGGKSRVDEVVRIVGGHGSIGSNPWSPDGKRFAYAAFDPPPPLVWIVFFTPADVVPPPESEVRRRLTKVALAAERFLIAGLKRWGYAPRNERIFQRLANGSIRILFVKGSQPVGSGRYQKPNFADEVIQAATRKARIAGQKHLWWIFSYLGAPPKRIDEYRGGGDPWNGGWAIVNYSTIPGEIDPEGSLAQGFNDQWTLKGTIHELGHAFGLPHVGPTPSLGLGNSLMGPNNDVYAARRLSRADQVYLDPASAAMLWKHPVLSGTSRNRARRPAVTLASYKAAFGRASKTVTLSGKVTTNVPAHSAVVLDDLGRPQNPYWYRGYAGRVDADGTFQVKIDAPLQGDGTYRLIFCFDNGALAGDHAQPDYYGAILKSYRFRNGRFQSGR